MKHKLWALRFRNLMVRVVVRKNSFRVNLALSILLLIIASYGIANSLTVSGIVIDSLTEETLPGVVVRLENSSLGTSTDINGRFSLSIDDSVSGDAQLNFHLIGFHDKTQPLDEVRDMDNLIIYLAQSTWKLDQVVVTATRREYILKDVPITTELITSREFRESGALTVDQALSSHIGVDISDDLSGKGVSLRGIDPSRVLILIDGERVIGRVMGSLDMGQISLANVDRIEIVKGTGATLYGSDAIGGVVNIITKKPTAINSFDIYSSYGSFNSIDLQTAINSSIIGKGLSLTTKYEHTDGFDLDKTTEHTNGLENTNRFNANSKMIFALGENLDLDFSLGFMIEKKDWKESEVVQIGPYREMVYNYDDSERNLRYDIAAKTRWQIDPDADFTFSAHGSYYDHAWKKFTRSHVWIDTSETVDDIFEMSFQYNRMLADNHILTFGGDISTQGLDSDQLATGSERVRNEDIYTQYEWLPVNKLVLLPGLRWEHHETYGHYLNPSINAMWDACRFFNLRASVNRGFQAPSIKELYFEFDHSAAGYIVYGGGEDLDPETSTNYSLTAEINYSQKAVHRLTYFRNDLKNLIEFIKSDVLDPTYSKGIFYYENIVKAKTEGIEWETQIKMLEKLDFSFSYTYLKAKNITDETDLVNRPEHTFKFNTGYLIEPLDTRVNFWGLWHDRKLWNSLAETPERISYVYAPSRWNLNASITRELFNNLNLFVRVDNLTDEKNAKFSYWPERSYKVSLNYNFSRSN